MEPEPRACRRWRLACSAQTSACARCWSSAIAWAAAAQTLPVRCHILLDCVKPRLRAPRTILALLLTRCRQTANGATLRCRSGLRALRASRVPLAAAAVQSRPAARVCACVRAPLWPAAARQVRRRRRCNQQPSWLALQQHWLQSGACCCCMPAPDVKVLRRLLVPPHARAPRAGWAAGCCGFTRRPAAAGRPHTCSSAAVRFRCWSVTLSSSPPAAAAAASPARQMRQPTR